MNNCIFCKIISRETNSEIIYEDEKTVAVLDVAPRSLGHSMVLPKVHAENILNLPDKEIEGVFKAVKKVAGILEKTFKPDGFTIGINHGKASGQVVDHLHIHIIPRWHGDAGGSIHSVVNPARDRSPRGGRSRAFGGAVSNGVNNPTEESLEEIGKRIRSSSEN